MEPECAPFYRMGGPIMAHDSIDLIQWRHVGTRGYQEHLNGRDNDIR